LCLDFPSAEQLCPRCGFGKVRTNSLFPKRGRTGAAFLRCGVAASRTKRWRNIDFYMVPPNNVVDGLRCRLGFKRRRPGRRTSRPGAGITGSIGKLHRFVNGYKPQGSKLPLFEPPDEISSYNTDSYGLHS
jgi:hypothetical protein